LKRCRRRNPADRAITLTADATPTHTAIQRDQRRLRSSLLPNPDAVFYLDNGEKRDAGNHDRHAAKQGHQTCAEDGLTSRQIERPSIPTKRSHRLAMGSNAWTPGWID
jgi:hypothetical protein